MFMIRETFSFSYCISTIFMWCCRVCYFAWWTRVLWGHNETCFLLKRWGPSNNCASGPLKASFGTECSGWL